MLRPPLILWRLLLSDLWRLLVIAAGVMVAVTAFASAVRPLATGQLGPLAAMKFMALAAPPMLQFVLPFAAGFAATLSYHRFAAENEATAAHAGGVSLRAILVPACITGLFLSGVLGALSGEILPRFLRSMESLLRRDAATLIINSIERGEAVEIEGVLVHADSVLRLGPDPEHSVTERLVLEHVVAIETDKEGVLQAETAAERAVVWLRSDQVGGDDATVVQIKLFNALVNRPGDVSVIQREWMLRPLVFPHGVTMRPKFLTTRELRQVRADPDRSPIVDRRRRALAAALAQDLAMAEVAAALAGEGRLVLSREGDERLAIRAGAVERDARGWRLVPRQPGAPVECDWRFADGAIRRQSAAAAHISIEADPASGDSSVTLELEGVVNPDAENAGRASLTHSGLRLNNDPAPAVFRLTSPELIAAADAAARKTQDERRREELRKSAADLSYRIERLRREVTGNQHERAAFASSCLVMTLCGAIMAMRLRAGLPLTVYLWSFFPALAAVITISGGENVVRQRETFGLIILWGGVAALLVYTLIIYLDLRRR